MRILRTASVRLALTATLAATAPGVYAQHHTWDYGAEHGPTHWGQISPEFAVCGAGHKQSPIDIGATEKADLPALQVAYKPSALRVVNNGHTILVTYDAGSGLTVGGTRYELKQFHFHHPSEEKVQGKAFDMVAHLVHAAPDGHLAVIAVLFQKGKESALLHDVFGHVPQQEDKEETVAGATINVASLLPADLGYYTYEGSLTAPPCSENVTWFVLRQPVQASDEELAAFSKWYPNNARPVQALNGRVVKETK
jgi:carbonic anhydrase